MRSSFAMIVGEGLLGGFRSNMLRRWPRFVSRSSRCKRAASSIAVVTLLFLIIGNASSIADAQKKRRAASKSQTQQNQATTQLEKLRDDYIKASKDYKASLEKLLPLYEKGLQTAEQKFSQSKELFSQGLISRRELDDSEHAVAQATTKVEEVRKQMTGADTQVAQALIEVQTDKQAGKLPRGGFLKSTSLIRYNGAGPWALSQVGKIDTFFRQKFGRPLPIAVFGQGAIHNQWHLDHRNALDVSVNPNGPEAQPLMDFLRANGIPFSAFRSAIPGVATGPHIHIGLPSHRY